MITECPTCHRTTISCPLCEREAIEDSDRRLPRWCSGCGAMLAEPIAMSRRKSSMFAARDIVGFVRSGRMRPPAPMIFLAIVCGIVASGFTFGMLRPPKDTPPGPRIHRATYSVQLPEKDWRFEPDRWESDGADLVVEGTFRGGKGMLLMVHVIHPQTEPLTLDALVQQTKQEWLEQMRDCVLLSDGGQTTVAG